MVTMEVDRDNGQQTSSSPPMDELQYSRLIYTLGHEAVLSLRKSRALIIGCKGLGAEIAKNLLLSGIAGIGLVDEEVVSIADLGSNFCLRELDVGRNRAVSIAHSLRELNPAADVDVITEPSIEASLVNYNLVAATSGSLPELIRLNWLCRSMNVPFIASQNRGLFSFVFADLGDSYLFKDESVESTGMLLVANVTQDNPATITVVEEQRHNLQDGDEVVFSGIKGMEELNQGGSFHVTVTGTHTFSIPVDTRGFGRYTSGGYFQKILPMKSMHFVPLERSIQQPVFSIMDNPGFTRQPQFHVALQALDEYGRLNKDDSLVASTGHWVGEADLEKMVARAREIWHMSSFLKSTGYFTVPSQGEVALSVELQSSDKTETPNKLPCTQASVGHLIKGDRLLDPHASDGGAKINTKFAGHFDEQLIRTLGQTTGVELCPLVAITGGLAAQEIIKVLGKMFTPLHQWIYYDAVDCLPSQLVNSLEKDPLQSRHDKQIALFGREFQQKLGNSQWLVVGAGGIGCEVLKNLVLMGVGCDPSGSIMVTDMDRISKPNYTDQLLYHIDDLGKQKAPTAGRALRKINPEAQIHAFQEKFDVETEHVFDSSFIQSLSGWSSTLD